MSTKSEKDRKAFQSYLDNIKAKTGKTPEDFRALAGQAGLAGPDTKPGQVVAWLKSEFGLGHGHAMALVHSILQHGQPKPSPDDAVAEHFKGNKVGWRKPYDTLISKVSQFGPDLEIAPTKSYISLVRGTKKFGTVQISSDRLDLGLKLKGIPTAGRLEEAGSWNTMVTHRVRITGPKQIDKEVLAWLKQAYAAA